MAPYDVLMDPDTIPKHPVLQNTHEKNEEQDVSLVCRALLAC